MANPNISVDVSGNTAKLQQQINQVAKKPLVVNVSAGAAGAAQPLGKLSGQITEIDKSLAAANARVIAFGAAAGSIFALQSAVVSLFQTFVNTEKKLQDINVILNLSQKNLASFGNSLFDIAGGTAQAFDVVAEAATEFSRQGLGVEETLKRTEAALILTRLSGLDAASSVSALTAAINSFQSSALEATEIVNKLANVDAAFAVSSADLANALSRVGSSADDAGISFDELIALVTTAQQITARGGSVIGNSLKTIFTRLGRGKVQEVLGGLGISATDESGQVKNQVQLLKELAVVYDTLSATQKNYVAEQVGGVFQINILKAALGDLGKEYSIYDRALQTSLSTTDQAIQRNEQLNQTLSALGSKTLANVQKAAGVVGEGLFGDAAKNVLSLTNLLAESVTTTDAQSVGGQIGKGVIDGLGKFIAGPGLALATGIIVKLLAEFTKYGAEAFKSILGANQAGKEQAIVQQNISKFLQNNSGLYNSILKGQVSVSAAAKEYLAVIQQQTLALQRQNSVAASISKSLGGAVGIATVGGKQYIATKGKNAAGGYLPEAVEQANINARVGGANPKTDKPVTIPNFALGGGKSGTVTAHTGEWVVPNFAGGDGSAIFNRDMKKRYGLPDGARKISASGFIPNFANSRYSYSLSTFAGKGVKNPRAEKQFDKYFSGNPLKNVERDDRISGVGYNLKRLKLPANLQELYNNQPGSALFASEFEKYAIQKLGFINAGTGGQGNVKLYGGTSSAVDGYKISNGIARFLEVKSGGFETLGVANKFGRVLPENLKRLPPQELRKIFKEGIRERQDIVKLENTLAVPDVKRSRRGNFNQPFRVADIEASRARSKARGFIPNFAKRQSASENINLGDISSNPAYRSKLVSIIIPQPSKKLLKFPAKAKYNDKTYTTTGFPVSGPNPDITKGLSNQSIPNLHRSLGKTILDQANIFGQSLGAKNFIRSVSQLPNLGGVNSAAGIAFEAGVRNAIGSSIGSKNARIDFTSTNPKIRQIFNNAPGVYEAKNRPSTSLINDGFLKFLSRVRPGGAKLTTTKGIAQRATRVQELTAQGLSKTQRNKILKSEGLAANGFVPNFAMSAGETNRGIPVSKIRAHFDKNGNPIAVTNTIDERNGLKDAIKRERRGIGMSSPKSSGFIPNFAIEDTTEKTESSLKNLADSFSAVALQIALFASIGALQVKDTTKLKETYRERAALERKAISEQKANLRKTSTIGPGPLQRGSPQFNAAMLGIEERARAERAARKSSAGLLARGTSAVKNFRPGIGTALIAPIVAETVANAIPQETRGGRVGASLASGFGQIASFAGIGGLVGGGPGAIIGGVIGSFIALKQTVDELNTSIPEFQAATEKSRENLARVNENTQNLLTSYEQYTTLLGSAQANQEDIDKAQKNFTEFLNKFDPKDADRIIKALETGGSEGLRTETRRVEAEAAENAAKKEAAEQFQTAFEGISFKLQSIPFPSAGSYRVPGGPPIGFEEIKAFTPEVSAQLKEAIISSVKLSEEPINDRLSRLGGIENVEKNLNLFIKDFLTNVFDEKQINEYISRISDDKNAEKAFIDLIKSAIDGLKAGAEQGKAAAKVLTESAGKEIVSTFSKEIISKLAGEIDSILSYNPKKSRIADLQNQFFAGDISRNEFIAQRSMERLRFGEKVGFSPEELQVRFSKDWRNVTTQLQNNLSQEAFDLGLYGPDFRERAANLAPEIIKSAFGAQGDVNFLLSVGDSLGNLGQIIEKFNNKYSQFTGPNKNEAIKSDLNAMINSKALSREEATKVYYNVMDKPPTMDLVTPIQNTVSSFELINSQSASVLSNFENVSSIASDIANAFSNIVLPNNTSQTNQPDTGGATGTTAPPPVSSPDVNFTLSIPSISISSESNQNILSQLDAKIDQAKQRIMSDVTFQLQQIRDRNGLNR